MRFAQSSARPKPVAPVKASGKPAAALVARSVIKRLDGAAHPKTPTPAAAESSRVANPAT